MGLEITVPGVNFANYVDIVSYPITDQLTSLFLLGTDSISSKVNYGSGADATGGGADITYFNGYARFAGLNTNPNAYLQTSDADNASADMTLISLVMREDSADRAIFGAYNGVNNGAAIGSGAAYAANGALVQAQWAKARPDTKFYLQAMVVNNAAGTVTPYSGVDGELVMGTPSSVTRVQSANAARIGGGYSNGTWAGVARISAVAKHTRTLTLPELRQVYTYLKSRAVKLGLDVS